MATKNDKCLLFLNQKEAKNTDRPFQNLNLNCNQHFLPSFDSIPVHSYSKSNFDKEYREKSFFNENQTKNQSWKKLEESSNLKPLKNLNLCNKKEAKNRIYSGDKSSSNNSTLSLHISAYENSVKALNENEDGTPKKSIETKNALFLSPKLQDPFEYPRQMTENGSKSMPEVMQFKASQKLASMNQEITKIDDGRISDTETEDSTQTAKSIAFEHEKSGSNIDAETESTEKKSETKVTEMQQQNDDEFGDFEEAVSVSNMPSLNDLITDQQFWDFEDSAASSMVEGSVNGIEYFDPFDDGKFSEDINLPQDYLNSLKLWSETCFVEDTAALKFQWNNSKLSEERLSATSNTINAKATSREIVPLSGSPETKKQKPAPTSQSKNTQSAMTEPPSKTSNHQRLEEMMAHLTPKGATIPYNLSFDSDNCIWVASKGGLFKLNPEGDKVLVEKKNIFPKKFAPYCQVIVHGNKVIHVQCEDVADITEFRILDLQGNIEHEQFIDGKIQSLAVNSNGEIFLTKQPAKGADEFFIYKTTIDVPLGWDELVSEFDLCFQSICCLDDSTLVAATCSIPNNIYSKQSIVILDSETGKIKKKFSEGGKDAGQIYFPRSIQPYKNGILILDKTGRIQHFDRDGNLIAESARIDAYIGNGFVVRNDEAVIACSGIVRAADGESICDDWLEAIKLDGSFWTEL